MKKEEEECEPTEVDVDTKAEVTARRRVQWEMVKALLLSMAAAIDFDSGDGETILRILMGENLALGSRTAANPREIVFIEPDQSRDGRSLGVVMDGDTPTKLLDTWGQVIHIRMDADYDKKIPNPEGGEGARQKS